MFMWLHTFIIADDTDIKEVLMLCDFTAEVMLKQGIIDCCLTFIIQVVVLTKLANNKDLYALANNKRFVCFVHIEYGTYYLFYYLRLIDVSK